MQTTATLLVLASAIIHAYWNFLLKRVGGGQIVIGLSKAAEAAVLLPVLLWAMAAEPASLRGLPLIAAVGALLQLANYGFLGRAYHYADLSFVYPLARGSILLFLPLLGWIFIGEHVDGIGAAGLGLIVLGIAAQLRTTRAATARGAAYALCAGAVGAGYTVWDKRAVLAFPALAYFAAYTVLVGAAYAAFVAYRYPRGEVRATWRAHRSEILQIAAGNSGAYILVLYALRSGISSYVIGLRQVSIAFGVLLGWWLLRERPPLTTWSGIVLLLVGCTLLVLAR